MKRISAAIVSRLRRHDATIERFWSHVRRDAAPDCCWEWQGCVKDGRYPTFFVGSHSIAPARIAWFAATGEMPDGGRLLHRCGSERCVRPTHLAWLIGRRTSHMLRALGDGYVTLPGEAIALDASGPRMPCFARTLASQSDESARRVRGRCCA
jgi:hypothetical protein